MNTPFPPPEGLEIAFSHPRAWLAMGSWQEAMAKLPEESVDLIITDPAYSGMNDHMDFGRGRIVGARNDPECKKWFTEFKDDRESFIEFLRACYRVMRHDRHIYVMFDSFSLLSLGDAMREVFAVKNLLVWDKVNFGMGHYFRRQHELIVFASRGKRKLNTRSTSDVLREPRVRKSAYPTQKPVALFARMIAESTDPEMVVLDPFAGSASSGVAALQQKCSFIGLDISADALEIARGRLDTYLESGVDPLEPWSTPIKKKPVKPGSPRR